MWPELRLPTPHDLAAYAAKCAVPCLAWVIDPSFIVQAIAGQLLPLIPDPVGVHIADLDREGSQVRLRSAVRALLGETVVFDTEAHGERWTTTIGPVDGPRGILGAFGVSSLSIEAVAPILDPETGLSFAFVRDTPDGHIGDLVTIRPGEGSMILRHSPMSQASFDAYLANGLLEPIRPASLASTPVSAPGDRRGRRVASGGRLRLFS